ncbi:MAG: hypothetical protein AB1567_03745 [bacterium]
MSDPVIEEIKEILKRITEKQEIVAKEQQELTLKQQQTEKEIDRLTKKTDAQIEKIDAQIEKTDKEIKKEIKKVNKMVGDLTDGWGKFVEGLVAPSIPKVFKILDIDVFDISTRRTRRKNGNELEVDILCLGRRQDGKEVVLVAEVKSDLQSKHIDEFVTEELPEFKKFFDEYQDKELIGIVAGSRLGDGVKKYAEKLGLYILAPSGNIMKLLNKPDFRPKAW